ncbi:MULTISPECIES: HAMP domain-containing sensor histidine kinase [Romboutsia]|uniref:histidine kinase n=1 Tax=Romboutsia hominis TaxID=1507512 RepID=A0A2P2BTU6_9FIRM|nr:MULTISPECIES: HAMP domain-containing sensor histidine kinase [Romboutsia]MCH1961053.1 ATP-binding protein [Romboutsia hominis]MCH1968516.1 ATP-binding protein [Romboutsia hominis]MDB8792829.1 ATP-binding protein [Romboutsia sp. 1001216sp1]MDB8795369.1 ATP-binding protein [Romboutsia sp. 1001216sp1]MDB8799179.1 ATP-binding protein [Romboutsia sp. 1001216sp1]
MEQLSTLGYSILLISIIISILSIRYTLRLRKYLEEFIYVSKKISNKEFHSRISSTAKGDLGELSRNFNEMIEIMDKTISDLDYSNLQKTSILKSISHGILAIDIDGNIMLINEEAKRMLKCDNGILVEGKNIKNVIKEEKLLEEINTFKGWKQNKTDELKINDDLVYKVSIDPIYLESIKHIIIGSIINIQDITEKVKLEHMRSDFVANVSHELKTPLTSISGFVETLRLNENIDVQTRNRFLSIIETESDRLKRLIDDILLLSFIENNEKIVYEGVSLYNVFLEVYEMTNYIAKSKNINLTYEFDDKSIVVFANRDYIKQVFLNLIDNAIKYTPENQGKTVKVSVGTKQDKIIIKVKDEGIGIPKEDINRIFERFYRVDKARSKEVGGTGLGLAIIKHIVKSLGGTIEVKSELRHGSEFIVNIPEKISFK